MGTNRFPEITNSQIVYERAKDLIPCFSQTMAKGPSQYVQGVAPIYLQKGEGAYVWDVDGNRFLDYNMAIGPISLGYCFPAVDEAIRKQLSDGITFSLMHPLEVDVAELIRDTVPNAEAIRFSKGGADVTSAAIRIARAYTGKDKILCCGYHGWHDWYVSTMTRNSGIPKGIQDLTFTFNYNDIESVAKSIDEDTAAIILEPVVFEEPQNDFLHKLRELCTEKGILLIFDEMWTGFRISLGGAQEYFGIDADMATFSKAVANGMPISVLTGKRKYFHVLEEDVFFFNTFGGETLSLAAAKATIEYMKTNRVPDYLFTMGLMLKNGFNEICQSIGLSSVIATGYPYRTIVQFSEKNGDPLLQKSLVQQELIRRGILWSGFHTLCYSHSEEDIRYTLDAYKEVLTILKNAIKSDTLRDSIEGTPVLPVFRKTGSFNTKPVNSKQ